MSESGAANGRVRLKYSGFVVFASRMLSIGTGLIFTLMVTRNVSPEAYGVYGNISDVVSYFTLASSIIPFWLTRAVARMQPGSSRTGLTVNALMGIAFTGAYLAVYPILIQALGVGAEYLPVYLIAAFTILEGHVIAALEAIAYPRRPEVLGFGLLLFEASKVVLGFILIIGLGMGLSGALASTIVAWLLQAWFYFRHVRGELGEGFSWAYVKKWFKASLLNVYSIVCSRIYAFTSILLFVYGGEVSRAYYGAASTLASIVGYSSSLAIALYPRLLSGSKPEDVTETLKLVLMFAIPMSVGALVLSQELLYMLNPSYAVAWVIVVLLSLNSLLSTVSSLFESTVSGSERVDSEGHLSVIRLVKSRLFKLITLSYVQTAVVVVLAYLIFSSSTLSSVGAALCLSSLNLLGTGLTFLPKYLMAKGSVDFKFPWVSTGKYLAASLVMASTLWLLQAPPKLGLTIGRVAFGALVYFAVLLAVDVEARGLLKALRRGVQRTLNSGRLADLFS
ncbi:MAG: hypothetical protein QFX33_00875 [Candidatus Nezhaarchaeota archaeon]|nr:hypothetical protein [Candidatus Nezhaarchaeota archaeon]